MPITTVFETGEPTASAGAMHRKHALLKLTWTRFIHHLGECHDQPAPPRQGRSVPTETCPKFQ
jgi:hypothetical protein